MTINNEQIQALKASAENATVLDLDSAQLQRGNDGYYECPVCCGAGEVEAKTDFCNIDGVALGVQFYGIGEHHGAAEAYFRAANPAAILSLLAERDADKALIAESVVLFETLRQRIAELEREKDAMTAAALAMRDDMREDRTLTVKLPKRATADKYVDGTFDNSDLAAIYNTCRLECEVKIKNACAAAGITLVVGE